MAKVVENTPEKVVIIAGPTFSEALRFLTFGFVLGAGTVYFLLSKEKETVAAQEEAATKTAIDRVLDLANRAKIVAERARDAAHKVQEVASPVVHLAVAQGKQVAAEVEHRLRKEIDEAKESSEDPPPATETEEKYVE